MRGIGYVQSELVSPQCFRTDRIDVRSGLQIRRVKHRHIAVRCTKYDIGIRHGFGNAAGGFYRYVQFALHFLGESPAVFLIAAEDADTFYVSNGRSGNQLHPGLSTAADNPNGFGVWIAEMAYGHAPDRSRSDLAKPFAQDDPFKFCVMHGPDGNDLRMFRSIEGFIHAEAGERLFPEYTPDRKHQVATAGK
ncbi:hypothetical protein FHT91_000352 [Rhizobium sp. BK347]|nr:hypothetical protein [Rhizobium sp. BK252]MBB3400134.1 hypothetical protein [Rhizobium sp. BK289]MBB3412714.1 hypothetical protein [Rhizobium sp. BK284]MBB3480600.1 hypothetical protein [Rhizobium sp. BK347]